MKSIQKYSWLAVAFIVLFNLSTAAYADISLSTDWQSPWLPSGEKVPPEQYELSRLQRAVEQASKARAASYLHGRPSEKDFEPALSFKMKIGGRLHYLTPVRFMSKSQSSEVCHPSFFANTPTYQCDEGQRHTQDCHILIFNERFEEVGYHRILINEPYQFFCNAIPAVGVGKKAANELLILVQYFPVDRKAASKVSEIGSGWSRMIVSLRLKPNADGQVEVEQDATCLTNPNRIETIVEARQKLKKCAGSL